MLDGKHKNSLVQSKICMRSDFSALKSVPLTSQTVQFSAMTIIRMIWFRFWRCLKFKRPSLNTRIDRFIYKNIFMTPFITKTVLASATSEIRMILFGFRTIYSV